MLIYLLPPCHRVGLLAGSARVEGADHGVEVLDAFQVLRRGACR
jgi:hypothetical protein